MALTEEGLVSVPGFMSRWVRLASGVKAHYMTSGESGPAVVLLHGGLDGGSAVTGWRHMAPFLGQNGFRVYCPDAPGFGLTDDPERRYAHGQGGQVDFVYDFVTALDLDRLHLAGNSMGCTATVNFTTAHPERVSSFALIAGHIGDLVDTRAVLEDRPKEERPALRMFDGTKESMKALMEIINYRKDAITDEILEMRVVAANRHRDYQEVLRKQMFEPDPDQAARLSTKGRFDRLSIPGIYLFGLDDVLMPVIVGHLHEDALPNVQFFYPDECGHQGQGDQPDMFNQVFLELFRDGRVSRRTADRAGVSKRRPELPHLVAAQ